MLSLLSHSQNYQRRFVREKAMSTKRKLHNLPDNLERLRVLPTGPAATFCGYRVDHWRALHRAGKTPPAIKMSARYYGWRVQDLMDWQESRKAGTA
jgi:hypothetical protein